MKHEIIVYRNPGEAALWDWVMNGSGGNVVVWLVCLGLSLFITAQIADKVRRIEANGYLFCGTAVILSVPLYMAVIWVLTYL